MSLPEPIASISTPIPYSADIEINRRPPLALLSEDESDDELQQQEEAFDRISDILNSLIQEANDAVQGIKKERVMIKSISLDSRRSKSRIPRPKPIISMETRKKKPDVTEEQVDSLVESFRRLDTSMAMVDSLSRDLATPKQDTFQTRWILFLLVPLLHIPHSFMTMLIELYYHKHSLFDLSSVIVWTCLLALANLVVVEPVDQMKQKKMPFQQKVRLPGSYQAFSKPVIPNKRTWIPTTFQTQHPFRLGDENVPSLLVRRKSI
ncbi:hypothetical protein BD560DRAFT_403125 [Blakeslea trispora]|nr:hypothetical protein BD560DRAFT_403125 [Blakeslea trispora]